MKNFFTSMLGALVALVVFSGGCVLLFVGFIAAIISLGGSEKAAPALDQGSYLVFDLSSNISDAPPPVDLGPFGGKSETTQLRTITRALRSAAKDERIAGVFITGELTASAFGSGYAALKEVRAALSEFKAAGKPISAYLTQATTRSYYLASVATDLAIDPYGIIIMPGLASQPTFYAGALEKYGVNVQVTRVGKYKAAVEPFTRRDMSTENREEVQRLLNDIWAALLADIAPSRNLTPEKIQATVDTEGIIRAQIAKNSGWVDRVVYRDEIFDELKAKTGRAGSREPFKQVTLENYAKVAKDVADLSAAGAELAKFSGKTGRIAVVYAEGEIVDGEGEIGEVGGSKFSRELRRLRQDDSVRAIVLRVNSPGGSASASEVIQREIRLIKRVKPIVVSMGSYAASGGYWISTYGDRIFAEPTTITGSIGVFGMQFDIKKLAGDFGVTFDAVKTGRYADALTISRPKSAEELAIFQRMVDWIYGEFVTKVADSRKIDHRVVEEIAQGRVWSGAEALRLKLVDEIGGLDAAIAHAAKLAKLGTNFRLVEYPQKKELIEAIQEFMEHNLPNRARSASLTEKVVRRIEAELRVLGSFNDPQGVYARLPVSFSID